MPALKEIPKLFWGSAVSNVIATTFVTHVINDIFRFLCQNFRHKYDKLLAAETRGNKRRRLEKNSGLKRTVKAQNPRLMPVNIIYLFEIIYIDNSNRHWTITPSAISSPKRERSSRRLKSFCEIISNRKKIKFL